jgi:hypothetical protein
MEPLRLDPADPLASVLAWLVALARALGIEPRTLLGPLPRPAAAIVRGWLADWSRQLRGIIHAKALRLARTMAFSARPAPLVASRSVTARAGAGQAATPIGRLVVAGSWLHERRASSTEASVRVYAGPDTVLSESEEAALQRRARAVFNALKDPRAATARLARRLALGLARAQAAAAAWRDRSPSPPRVLGAGFSACVHAPEPRPPNLRASAFI